MTSSPTSSPGCASGTWQTAEADPRAEAAWVAHVNQVANTTLYVHANSWYLGANIPGKPRVFMPYPGGVGPYRQKCNQIAHNNYQGFILGNSSTDPQSPPDQSRVSL